MRFLYNNEQMKWVSAIEDLIGIVAAMEKNT